MSNTCEEIRQEEIEYFLSLIKGICCEFKLTFCAATKNGNPYLKLIDDETGREYGMIEDYGYESDVRLEREEEK